MYKSLYNRINRFPLNVRKPMVLYGFIQFLTFSYIYFFHSGYLSNFCSLFFYKLNVKLEGIQL